tara:strand:+ start:846 stop:1601 length:756 start_codon:yes stop_codon:yes gene_type:complete
MGIRRGSITTSIVADGLVFNMDPANRASTIPKSNVTVIKDTVNNITGSVNNEYDIWEGPTTASFALDGNDDYINFESFSGVKGLYALTVSIWYKSSVYPASLARLIGCNQFAIYQPNGSASNMKGRFYYIAASQPYGNGFFTLGGTSASGVGDLVDGNWHNLCFTYDGNNTTAVIYEDGVAVITKTDVTAPNGTFQLRNTTGDLVIGANSANPTNNEIVGNIGPAQVYNRALSSTEVLHNYNALKGRFGLS